MSETVIKISNLSKKSTILFFSTEKLNHGDYKLLKSARYSHSENYISKLLDKYSFKIIDKKDVMIRKHKSASVMGQIYLTEYIV